MKKAIVETFEKEKEITIEELVKEFFEESAAEDYSTIEEVLDELDWYVHIQKINISDEEEILLENAIEKAFNEKCLINKQLEIDKLQNRKNIVDFLEDLLLLDDGREKGDVGFLLSAEEIIDLIIKNGNK